MEATKTKSSKNRRTWLILVLILIVVLIAGGVTYVYYQYTQPKRALDNFLKDAKALNLKALAGDLQSGDITPLQEADIDDPAYADFFRKANELMTYKIKGMSFHGQTATVTADIHYADATDIYKSAISDFMKQVASAAFAGQEMSSEEMHTQLAEYLAQHSQTLGETYADVTIDFSMVKEGGKWYVDALDDKLVQAMSANFKSVESQLAQAGSGQEEAAPPVAAADSRIDLTTDKFTIAYTSHKVSKDLGGSPCLLVYYDYTNNSDTASSAMVDVSLRAYQNGKSCEPALAQDSDPAIDQYTTEIQPGQTVNVCQVFTITDTSDVTLEASEAYSFNDNTSAQLLKLQ